MPRAFVNDDGEHVKECCVCHEILSVDEFWKHNKMKDGLQSQCKACHKEKMRPHLARHVRAWEERNPEKVAEYRDKAKKRRKERMANDPEYAAMKKEYWRQRYLKKKAELANETN